MSALSTLEVLRGAKDALGERGWIQGDYVNPEGAVCLRGALNVAAGAVDPACQPSEAVEAHHEVWMALRARGIKGGPIKFNDEPGRTLAEVYAVLNEAIERVEAGGSR